MDFKSNSFYLDLDWILEIQNPMTTLFIGLICFVEFCWKK